jgi:Ca-activated chloride channel family protein
MPDEARPAAPAGGASGPPSPGPGGRSPLPWGLIALVFVPAAIAYVSVLRQTENFRFAHPAALSLVPLSVALVLWAGIRHGAGRRAALVHSRATELGRKRRGLVARLKDLPTVLRLLVVVLVAVALARPQTAHPEPDLEVEGIDIVIVLDMSGSMEESDLLPNRLEAAKAVIRDFVTRRPTDRIGLVVFGREAFTHVPLTLDHGAFLRMLAELRLGMIDGKGTAIGNGLGVALARLRRSEARSKVAIVLTDGDNNAGNISPREAAGMAQKLGVRVYTILAGDNESTDDPRAPGGARQRFPVNPKLLEEIATTTGGVPYLATDTRALAKRFQDILEELEKTRLKDRGVLYAELYPRFLLPALFVLLAELVLRMTRFRRLP